MILLLWVACIHFPVAPDIRARPPPELPTVLIQDVRVFHPDGTLDHQDVRLVGGVITSVTTTGRGAPSEAQKTDEIVDGRGRTLLPGLIDLHVHLALSAAPPWFLAVPDPAQAAQSTVYAGVTTVLDLGGDPKVLLGLQAAAARGAFLGPRIVFAGPGLTVEGAYPLSMLKDVYGGLAYASVVNRHFIPVRDVQDIEQRVDDIADAGGQFVKLMVAAIPPGNPATLSEELVIAATARAHARGLRVAAHVDDTEDALLCARAGVDLLAHGVETSLLTPADLATLRAAGIGYEPTLVNWQRFDDLVALDFQPTVSERATQAPAVLKSFDADQLRRHEQVLTDSTFNAWAEQLTAHREDRIANAAAVFAAGIPLYVGSDSGGSIATFPGAMHDELRLLVEAGIPNVAVLTAATWGNARLLDPAARFGLIAEGYAADLLLVEGDPTLDITRTEAIVQVWVGGAAVR